MAEQISSLQNPRVKQLVRLQEKSSERRRHEIVVVEGAREIGLALAAGFDIVELYSCPSMGGQLDELNRSVQIFTISPEVFKKVAYREHSDGLIALLRPKAYTLSSLELSKNPLLIVLEGVEKPGNLGAVLRTADAAQIDAVIICDPRTDIYNPNVIRSSVGCVFTTQVLSCTSDELKVWLKQKGIRPYAAALTAHQLYHQTDFQEPCALVFGTEADGLTSAWLNSEITPIKIPMAGKIDSLNVSNSVAIMAFEAMRQRDFILYR